MCLTSAVIYSPVSEPSVDLTGSINRPSSLNAEELRQVREERLHLEVLH